ncbi:autolysin [Clostridium puniceum]|uniref:Autolysin n=1 Tax=Clostridium puniceum TaxID=29367 RepID=A0A1S8SWY3_9CLOT|nr:cell wall-binding protein [Clostridium puniceum]OOM70017.1 autolysin [Clostridium puniceum]
MKKLNLKKIIVVGLITTSILGVTSIGANATYKLSKNWKHNSTGWWYTEGNSYAIGWRKINNIWYYFDNNGYMKTGWLQDGGNWYYFNANGEMANGKALVGYDLCDFDSNGKWKGYIFGNSQQTTNDFTFEKAVEILKTLDNGQFYSESYRTNIEYTKGGYNGYPVEDKVYTINNGERDLKYRIVGVIYKTTGEYYGVVRVFEIGYAEEYPRDTYGVSNTLYNSDGVTIDERTFDKKGDWFIHQNQTQQQTQLTDADQEEMDRMSNPEYSKNHMDEYNRLVAKYANK